MRVRRIGCVLALLCLFAVSANVQAGGRRFTYTYEATPMPKGMWEYEQWVTWKTNKESTPGYDRFDFRQEIEWGATDKLTLALYLPDWRYDEHKHKGDFRDIALEAIYSLSNPVTDPIGLALYGEIGIGDEKLKLEGKLLLQKNFGPVVLAYNAILEAEWEGHHFDEDKGEIEQTLGISYQFSPKFMVGAELLHEFAMPDWAGIQGKGVLYAGPNVSYHAEKWWATLTPLIQVSDVDDEPDFQMRLLVGFPFGGN